MRRGPGASSAPSRKFESPSLADAGLGAVVRAEAEGQARAPWVPARLRPSVDPAVQTAPAGPCLGAGARGARAAPDSSRAEW